MSTPALATMPITDAERDGSYQVVLDQNGRFDLVHWCADVTGWVFSSGAALDFEPTHYLPGDGHG